MTSEKRPSLSETHKLPSVLSGAESYKLYLEAVCNNATVALFIMDERQQCVYMNAAAERLTGYSLAEVQGQTLHDVIHHTRPDGCPYPLCECPIDRAFPKNNQEQGEEVFVHKDGHFYPVAYTASPIREASGVVGTVIEVRNIAQEKLNEAARHEAAAALHQSEERFRQFSENVKDVFWITDLRTPRLLYINSAYERIWQRSRESLYQTYNWLDTVHPDDRDRVRSVIAFALTAGYEVEYRIVRPDGSIRWIRDRGFVLPEANGEPYRMAGIAEDITDRKAAEFERQRLTTLIDNSDDFIGIATMSGQAVYVNPAGQALVGLKDLDAVRQTQILDYFLPDDRAVMQNTILPYLLQHGSWRGEARLRHFQTDATIPVDYSLFVVTDPQTNEPIGLATISRDVTQQKQAQADLARSEAKFRQMTDVLPQVIWTADPDGTIDYYNQYWEDYTGTSRTVGGEAVWKEIVHPADHERVIESWMRSIREEVSLHECEHRNKNRAGEYRWHLSRAVPYRNEQGQIIKWFGTTIDIHEQKLAIEARSNALMREQAAREEAEQANRIKDEFLAVLSHELRTPLNPILGWTKLLRNGKLDAAKTEIALTTIDRNAQLQAQLIEDLLDVSRILRNKLTLDIAEVKLIDPVLSALEMVRLTAESKQIQLQTRLAATEAIVQGDASRLQQIVSNLLTNAIKFTPAGGRVQLFLTQQESIAQIQVTDNGKGISPDFLPHLFEHFRQEDSSSTRQFGGLGLGLAIVRQLVELHGGSVAAESPGEGQGATFTVKLPLSRSEGTVQDASNLSDSRSTEALAGIRVLIVDDEPDSLEFVQAALEQEGAIVQKAASGFEAIDMLPNFAPHILLSDIGMPELDGYGLLLRIRQTDYGRTIPAIALTAYASELDRQRSIQAGFQQHIAKPIDSDVLIHAILTLCGNSLHRQ